MFCSQNGASFGKKQLLNPPILANPNQKTRILEFAENETFFLNE